MPVEAQAAGRPVIALRAGGVLETVVEGVTGIFFDRQDSQSLQEAIRDFDPGRFDPETSRRHAMTFDVAVFKQNMLANVEQAWKSFSHSQATLTKTGHLISVPVPDTNMEGHNGTAADEKRVV